MLELASLSDMFSYGSFSNVHLMSGPNVEKNIFKRCENCEVDISIVNTIEFDCNICDIHASDISGEILRTPKTREKSFLSNNILQLRLWDSCREG